MKVITDKTLVLEIWNIPQNGMMLHSTVALSGVVENAGPPATWFPTFRRTVTPSFQSVKQTIKNSSYNI
jgi:hypothetical protein